MRSVQRLAIAAGVSFAFISILSRSALADTGTWNAAAPGTYSWDDATKWFNNVVADGAGNTADFNSVNPTGDITVNLDVTAHTLGNLIFGDTDTSTAAGWTIAGTTNALNLDNLGVSTPTITVNSLGTGKSTTISALLSGSAGLLKSGVGQLVLTNANGLSGGVTVNQGTLSLDFSTSALTSDIVNNSNSLTLGGGTLLVNGSANPNSQTLGGTTLNAGISSITVNSSVAATTLNTGTIARNDRGIVEFTLPTTGTINTGTVNTLFRAGTSNGMYAYITDGSGNLLDYAQTDASGNIIPGSTATTNAYTPNPHQTAGTGADVAGNVAYNTTVTNVMDFTVTSSTAGAITGLRMSNSWTVNGGVRFNTNRGGDWTIDTSSAGRNFANGGVLVTNNVGPYNVNIIGPGNFRSASGSANNDVLAQDNTNGLLIVSAIMNNNGEWVKIGKGTVSVTNPNNANNATGQVYVNQGTWMIANDGGLGAPGTGAAVNLNSGILVGNGNVALDNSNGTGTNARSVVLGSAMTSTLAATTGNTMTVSGAVSNSTSGSPASLNIGTGTIVGTGAGTENAQLVGNGTVALTSSSNSYSGNTSVGSGATLQINSSVVLGASPRITLDNGTLQYATGSSSTDISTKTLQFGAGGATINTNGNNVSFANSVGGGGTGSFTKAGAGTLTFAAGNSYSGGTIVSGGTLLANNTTGSATSTGSVTVNSGGILGGGNAAGTTGFISGPVTVNSGGILAPGSSVGTLHLSNSLTLAAGSILNYEFNSAPSNDLTMVSGNLNIDNGAGFNLFSEGTTATWSTTGTYDLIKYNGTLNGGTPLDSSWTNAAGNNSHVLTRIGGLTYAFSTTVHPGFLDLIIGGTLPSTWVVNADGNWGVNTNWTPAAQPNAIGATAQFQTAITVPHIVTVEAPKTVGNISFSNSAAATSPNIGYTIAGTSSITLNNAGNGNASITDSAGSHLISAPLVLSSDTDINVTQPADVMFISNTVTGSKNININPTTSNTGTVSLTGNNTGYSGTTTLAAGTLIVGSGSLGSGALNVTGNSTLQAGAPLSIGNTTTITAGKTLSLATGGNNVTISGSIGESGTSAALNISGGGTVILTSNNSYSGTTTIGSGTTLQLGNATGSAGSGAITDNGALVFNRTDTALQFTQPISGTTGTVTQQGSGTTTLSTANTFGGNTTISGGTLVVDNSLALQNSTLQYNSGGGNLVFSSNVTTAATLGNLNGDKDLTLQNANSTDITLTVGGNNVAATTFSGRLLGGTAANVTKVGTGNLTLTGANTYGGNTVVNSGILTLGNGNANSGVISGNVVTISGGNLTVNGGSLTASALSAAGNTSNAGTLDLVSGSASFNAGIGESTSLDGSLIKIEGGNFTTTDINIPRNVGNTTLVTATNTNQTTSGLYVTGGTVNLGTLEIGTGNSSGTARVDGGNVTASGAVTVADVAAAANANTRFNLLIVNGGTFTSTDPTNGIVLTQGPNRSNAELLMFGGITTAEKISFEGTSTTADTARVQLTGGTLYLGGGSDGVGFVMGAGTTTTTSIQLDNGTIGAKGDWTSALGASINSSVTFQAAAADNTPHNISISGNLTGGGELVKTGGGTLTLSGNNNYSGTTHVVQGKLQLGAAHTIDGTGQMSLEGGTLATGGFDQSLGQSLNVSANSIIDLGGSGTVSFAGSNGSWGGSLEIKNWNFGSDHLLVGGDGNGLAASQLAQIHFDDFHVGASISNVTTAAITSGEVTPEVGDINQDGIVSAADVSAMMTALTNKAGYQALHFATALNPAADVAFILDVNHDGIVDNTDLQAEISLLANGGGGGSLTAVPEPASLVLWAAGGIAVLAGGYRAKRRSRSA